MVVYIFPTLRSILRFTYPTTDEDEDYYVVCKVNELVKTNKRQKNHVKEIKK